LNFSGREKNSTCIREEKKQDTLFPRKGGRTKPDPPGWWEKSPRGEKKKKG